MKDERTELQKYQDTLANALFLAPYGWRLVNPVGHFERDGKIFDLTAADITKHEEIFQNGTFQIL